MKFYKQEKSGTCQINAIQTIWSYYGKDLRFDEIKKDLPAHTFGNFITEIGVYFRRKGIETNLISNYDSFNSRNKAFLKSFNEYKKHGVFIDEIPTSSVLSKAPILINVDWYKIKNHKGGPDGHYVVILKEKDNLWLYDGSNYKKRVKTTLNKMLKASIDINRSADNGMWLTFY